MYQKLYNKFLQMIRQAFYSVVSPDTSQYPQAQVTSNGKATNVTRLSTYGVFGNPPLGAHVLMFQSQAQEAVKFAIFNDMIGRKKGLSEGECGLFNSLTEAIVYLKEDGSIAIESSVFVDVQAPEINAVATVQANVTAPAIVLNGAVTINGALVVSGTIGGPASGAASMPNGADIGGIPFGTHKHGGVDAGTDTSGGPQ